MNRQKYESAFSGRYASKEMQAAFSDENGCAERTDILRAMNRMSSMIYILMIREKAGK